MTNKFNVNKARFLAVAAAFAGLANLQACSSDDDGADDGGSAGTSAGSRTTAGSPSLGGADAAAGQGGASSGSAAMATGGTDAGADAGGAATGGAGEGGSAAAGEGGAAGAGMVCDDSVGTPLCDEVSSACAPYCVAASQKLKPAVAVPAIACLEADITGSCDTGYDCITNATAFACTEDVATACEIANMNCMNMDVEKPSCVELVSAFNDDARAEMLLCLEMYCDSPYTCAEGFFFDVGG